MALFLRHEACEQCGSRDNKGVYDDGSTFCFGCRHSTPPDFLKKISKRESANPNPAHKPLPADTDVHYSNVAVTWFTKYGVGLDVLLKYGVKFSPSRNQIIFTWPDTPLWQARNLDKEYRDKEGTLKQLPKYFTSGDSADICPVYHSLPLGFISDTLVLTEDALSAIKIASARREIGLQCDAMPLLGIHLPTKKLMALRGYKRLLVWLDSDKFKEAVNISNRAQMVGYESKAIYTQLDPKEYVYEQIEATLR